MTRSVAREVARWARAVVVPAAALGVVVAMHAAAKSVEASLPATHAVAMWRGVVVMTASWLVYAIVLAALQPRRDERAAEHVQDMRVRAGLPDHALLCILDTVWTSPAGQRVAAVDVRTGVVCEVWLSESSLAPGSYALVSLRLGAAALLDWAAPTTVAYAKGRRELADSRRRQTSVWGTMARRERRAAAEVVRRAESITRGV